MYVLHKTCRDELRVLMVIMPNDLLIVNNVLKSGDFTNIPLIFWDLPLNLMMYCLLRPLWESKHFYDAKTSLWTMVKLNLIGFFDMVSLESMKKYGKLMAKNVESIKKGLNIEDWLWLQFVEVTFWSVNVWKILIKLFKF